MREDEYLCDYCGRGLSEEEANENGNHPSCQVGLDTELDNESPNEE